MFSADLSWTDDNNENVGEHRARKAKEKDMSGSRPSSSLSHSHRSFSRQASLSNIISGPFRRPSLSKGTSERKTGFLPLDLPSSAYKDPALQPDWTIKAKISKSLPSGALLDPPPPFSSISDTQPRLKIGDTNPFSRWSIPDKDDAENICQAYDRVKDGIFALQTTRPELRSPVSFSTRSIGNISALSEEPWGLHSAVHELGSPETPRFSSRFSNTDTGHSSMASLKDLPAVLKSVTISVEEVSSSDSAPSPPKPSAWNPPSEWNTSTKIIRQNSQHSQMTQLSHTPSYASSALPAAPVVTRAPLPSDFSDSASVSGLSTESMHYQRLIYRMENASHKVMRDRLHEEWTEPIDQTLRDELQLEKQLWTLTALATPVLDKFTHPDQPLDLTFPIPELPSHKRRRILELDGGIWEIYQASTVYPNSKITQLAASLSSLCTTIPLPPQAIRHMVPTLDSITSSGNLPLPLPHSNLSMHLIRCSRLPSLLPSTQLPILLKELHRVLKINGVLELRLVDALPDRAMTGPMMAMWLEDHLTLNLEREFRCSRPMSLVPRWAQDAGFSMVDGGKIGLSRLWKLPAAVGLDKADDALEQVACSVLRNVWKDTWGSYVQSGDEAAPFHWWWEDEEVLKECMELGTTWNVGSLVVVKWNDF